MMVFSASGTDTGQIEEWAGAKLSAARLEPLFKQRKTKKAKKKK